MDNIRNTPGKQQEKEERKPLGRYKNQKVEVTDESEDQGANCIGTIFEEIRLHMFVEHVIRIDMGIKTRGIYETIYRIR